MAMLVIPKWYKPNDKPSIYGDGPPITHRHGHILGMSDGSFFG